jgi:crotonobetainyl-CoA:carnitine CoA-transferase CaiB-like acyl-CoA transferase
VLGRNERLVYVRVSGFGQEGSIADKADMTSISSRYPGRFGRWSEPSSPSCRR